MFHENVIEIFPQLLPS